MGRQVSLAVFGQRQIQPRSVAVRPRSSRNLSRASRALPSLRCLSSRLHAILGKALMRVAAKSRASIDPVARLAKVSTPVSGPAVKLRNRALHLRLEKGPSALGALETQRKVRRCRDPRPESPRWAERSDPAHSLGGSRSRTASRTCSASRGSAPTKSRATFPS
jgi:hypothetical protein